MPKHSDLRLQAGANSGRLDSVSLRGRPREPPPQKTTYALTCRGRKAGKSVAESLRLGSRVPGQEQRRQGSRTGGRGGGNGRLRLDHSERGAESGALGTQGSRWPVTRGHQGLIQRSRSRSHATLATAPASGEFQFSHFPHFGGVPSCPRECSHHTADHTHLPTAPNLGWRFFSPAETEGSASPGHPLLEPGGLSPCPGASRCGPRPVQAVHREWVSGS